MQHCWAIVAIAELAFGFTLLCDVTFGHYCCHRRPLACSLWTCETRTSLMYLLQLYVVRCWFVFTLRKTLRQLLLVLNGVMSVLRQFHWLPAWHGIEFKVSKLAVLVYKAPNGLSLCTSKSSIVKLQRVQNALARIVTNTRRSQHTRPVLQRLHWLPISYSCNVSPQDTLNCTPVLPEHPMDWIHTSQTTSLQQPQCDKQTNVY